MRNGTAIALALAFCVTSCGERVGPVPEASDSPRGMLSEAVAASGDPRETTSSTDSAVAPATIALPHAAAITPAAASVIPVRLHALGTEPFWNAQINGGMLTYTTPADQKGQRAALARRNLANGAEYLGKLGGATIRIEVTKRTCSDGMSNRSYPFTVILTVGRDRRGGCAS